MLKSSSLVCLFLFFYLQSFSQNDKDKTPIQTDRPDQTESPSITPKNQVQMEIGFVFEDKKPEFRNLVYPNILTKYGINKRFELRLVTELTRFELYTPQGAIFTKSISPTLIGFKSNFIDENKWIPKTSVIVHIGFPQLASKIYHNDAVFTTFRFLMQHTLNDKFSLSYNLGAEWDGVTTYATGIYTLALGYTISDKFGCYGEFFGFVPQRTKSEHQYDMGLTYLINNNIQLDCSGGIGLTETAPKYYVGCGVSFRTGY